jgi:cephalosporin-C deacetylase-like acetyl esterase
MASAAFAAFVAMWPTAPAPAQQPATEGLAEQIRKLDGRVLGTDQGRAGELAGMLARDVKARMQTANLRASDAWDALQTRADWERFRDLRLQALRESLGSPPVAPGDLKVLVTRTLAGEGYRIENLVVESRPGLVVTANLYSPERLTGSMPGILIAHSHHNPCTEGELQDMGMTWARQGCIVLVIEHIGHGERRQHPFRTQADYPRPFRVGRQDYYFRYNSGMQLQLIGESLMGWMVWDLRRGLDVLLSRPGIDKDRIVLLGAVAGGGDPAAVTTAIDSRVTAVVPFNFGGPQPDYGNPADPRRDFYYFGVADWESTRCLRLGARDGFAQWLIVAAAAPRRLIYAKEFTWDQEHDPVWPRFQKVFDWYGAADRLAVAVGRGTLRGTPPESSHCNNIGPLHRSKIYPTLERWFDMPIPEEYQRRRKPDELACLTPEAVQQFAPRPLHELASELGARRGAAARQRIAGLSPAERRQKVREGWSRLLGEVEPKQTAKVLDQNKQAAGSASVEHVTLEVEPDIVVPLVLLMPENAAAKRLPAVLCLAQEGKQAFLEQRSEAIAQLIEGGAAVCLLDVRGTGETRPRDSSRGRSAAITSISATEWVLGQTLVGSRLRDLRSVVRYLRSRADIDPGRVALWGDSFSGPNPAEGNLAVPLDADPFPQIAEPLGGLLALFGALFEDGIRAIDVQGGLSSFDSLLHSPFCYVPHDALIPGALTEGDLCDVAAALAPIPLRMQRMVDGLNRAISPEQAAALFEPARAAYRARGAEQRIELPSENAASRPSARWMLQQLRAE